MPCGLRNAGAAYCRLVQAVVDETNDPGLSAYLDDMILHTDDPDAHVDLLDRTLAAYYQSGIKLKAKKTILFKAAVDYLGFKADQYGIKMTDKYVGQIKEWPQPTSGKELATALRFFGYKRDFLPQFAELTAEMNEVKTKRRWEADTWTPELQSKFQQIKDLFTEPAGGCRGHPMALGEPGTGEYILITDCSKEAVGAILHQLQHRVTRFIEAKGRKCRAYEKNYHSSKGELLALYRPTAKKQEDEKPGPKV